MKEKTMIVPSEILLATQFVAAPTVENQNHYLQLQSGGRIYTFFLDSVLAKKIAKQLSKQVEAFEKENGEEFDDRLDNEPMKSPFGDEK